MHVRVKKNHNMAREMQLARFYPFCGSHPPVTLPSHHFAPCSLALQTLTESQREVGNKGHLYLFLRLGEVTSHPDKDGKCNISKGSQATMAGWWSLLPFPWAVLFLFKGH